MAQNLAIEDIPGSEHPDYRRRDFEYARSEGKTQHTDYWEWVHDSIQDAEEGPSETTIYPDLDSDGILEVRFLWSRWTLVVNLTGGKITGSITGQSARTVPYETVLNDTVFAVRANQRPEAPETAEKILCQMMHKWRQRLARWNYVPAMVDQSERDARKIRHIGGDPGPYHPPVAPIQPNTAELARWQREGYPEGWKHLEPRTMTPREAWLYAAEWGSAVTGGDPGACMYGFSEDCHPQSEDHRTACLCWIDEDCLPDVAKNPENFDTDETEKLYALRRYLVAAKVRA